MSKIIYLDGVLQNNPTRNYNIEKFNLTVAANTQITEPIQRLFQTTTNTAQEQQHTITIGKNSHAIIIDEYVGANELNYAQKITVKIILAEDATLTFYKLQNESLQATHAASYQTQQQAHSQLTINFLSLGSLNATENWQITLDQPNCSCNQHGICLPKFKQNLSYQTQITHAVSNCSSNLLCKNILTDFATCNFQARVTVAPHAKQTIAHVTNKNLLLTNTATVNTLPELEIYADDVICTHGATVGQLDNDAVFYLQSRGLTKAQAENLLLAAFTGEIIEQMHPLVIAKCNQLSCYHYDK